MEGLQKTYEWNETPPNIHLHDEIYQEDRKRAVKAFLEATLPAFTTYLMQSTQVPECPGNIEKWQQDHEIWLDSYQQVRGPAKQIFSETMAEAASEEEKRAPVVEGEEEVASVTGNQSVFVSTRESSGEMDMSKGGRY